MKWKIIKHETLYKRYFSLEEYRLRYERFGGGEIEAVREIFERGHAVVVLPYDARRDEVVLIEQFRPGAIHFSDNPWLLELVAGVIEPGEEPEDVARREAQEEAGCTLGELLPIHRYLVSPGGTTESAAVYVGNVDSSGVGGLHGLEDEHEDIKVHVVSRVAAMDLMNQGRIINASALIGLQWLAMHYAELRSRWS